MAISKAPVPKHQKSITSFFGGGKEKALAKEESSDVEMEDDEPEVNQAMEEPDSQDDEPIVTGKSKAPDSSNLPPIHSIPAMFADLVSHIPKIKDVVEHIQGRKLRVATMCSGTESPLLALELIRRSIFDLHGVNLEIEHVFSCEIEPFKQAYIERNFHPPILFRDVCELGEPEATTAYGAKASVPGDVDLLVAGTSCVDYSNLNNEKQDIDGNGESGRTFRGMMSWVKNHRPPIVILENVCSAPWDRVAEYFNKNGYSATHSRVDTKHYYIPHTRTRVYLIAVDERQSKIPTIWKEWITSKLKRHASSTLDAFLLPSDDPRIHQARQKLVQEGFNALDRRTGRTDWGRCESRHQRARLEEELGAKRPLTSWEEGGYCKLPDFAWTDWGVGQVERVWDLLDISLLRSAQKDVDPSYKTLVWNLSQNVDRSIGSSKLGICPCLTPSMIPYITNRGGPMVGLEALSMQGLPVDELLLTRETEDQLADLAGNAMSTTVVGACILAALVSGKKLLKAGDDCETYESKGDCPEYETSEAGDEMITGSTSKPSQSTTDNVTGEDQLVEKPLDLSVTSGSSISSLLVNAAKSARLCGCEGRKDMTNRELSRCLDCGTSSCKKCGGRPEHNFEVINVIASPRMSPSAFEKELKSALPMCFKFSNVTQTLLDDLKDAKQVSIPHKRWQGWRSAVLRAVKSELRFVEPKRQEIWSAVYRSSTASLEFHLHPQQPEWRFYALPEESEPANSELRQLLELPVARLVCGDGMLDGHWQFALPHAASIPITIEGAGSLVPAWGARLGLQDEEHKDGLVHSQLKITVPKENVPQLDRDISGLYTLLDKCGSANGALHKRHVPDNENNLPPIFMLLDPRRCSDSDDCFLFSISSRRYEFGESRPVICKLDPQWRQSDVEGSRKVTCFLPCQWAVAESVLLTPSHGVEARFSTPEDVLNIDVSINGCQSTNAVLICRVPLGPDPGSEWPRGKWQEVDKVQERSTFKALAWLLERIRHVDDRFNSWQAENLPEDYANCERCAPTAPALEWRKVKQKMAAFENSIQAGEYERSLKRRPSPFVTQLKLDDNGTGTVRVGINIPSLLHRALSRLPSENRPEQPIVTWRLNTDFTPLVKLYLPNFTIASNKRDPEHPQPPSFKVPLRKEQLRSLEWMLKQEDPKATPFVEEEISEAMLDPLGWRIEGRAQRPVHVRGGVLADQVGYGKTAITLGLIDCAAKTVDMEFSKMERVAGKISVKATLVIVPPHLTRQWDSEVRKFTGKRFKTIVLSTASNLNSMTIEDVEKADMVIVASNLFHSNVYLENLEVLAAAGPLPSKDGRHFNDRLQNVLAGLRSQTDLLQNKGSVAVMKKIRENRAKSDAEAAEPTVAPTKRLKGKSYRDAAAAESSKPNPRPKTASMSSATPNMKMEVVIEVLNPSNKRKSSPAADETGEDDDDEKPRKRRAISRKSIIISDDEEDEGGEKVVRQIKKKPQATSGHSKKSKDSESSDYNDTSPDEISSEDETEVEMPPTTDDEQSSRTSKSKSKPKAKMTGKSSKNSSVNGSSSEADDSMEVDEAPKAGKKSAKGKAAPKERAPAKLQKRREDSDPWKLESSAVKRDWNEMKAPPLEMFYFSRKVVDEYTYLDGKVHSMVTKLTAERHWVLSGTPPIHDFGAVKTIAAFLNLHLGVDDDAEGQSAQVKKRRREQTAVEKFHSFREVHSLEWHAHRHEVGQSFLDRFVRQNIAEIDEIPWTEKIEKIVLPAAERAIYLELEHHLRALDMTIKRGKKTESDREKRLAKSLGDSNSAEEALLKRCSHFDLETSNNKNAMKACDVIVEEREKQLEDCKKELLQCLEAGVKREKNLCRYGDDSMFLEYGRVTRAEGVGDEQATQIVEALLDGANVPKSSGNSSKTSGAKAKAKGKSKGDEHIPEKVKELMWEHREKTHEIRRLTKELVGRVRSLRYFKVVRDLQKQSENPPSVSCPGCGRKDLPLSEIAVLSSCGHMGCMACVKTYAEKEECVYAASGACNSAARVLNVVQADTLGVDESRDKEGRHFGLKLEKVIHKLRKELPKNDRVLIFVQFPDLMKKVAEALEAHNIKFLEIKGTAHQKSKNLEKFQNDSDERVLLLNVMDESASGANLTSANHAVFLSPLLAPSKEIYKACETQAIGRLVRYGQEKHVYVWRYLSTNTIDEEIYAQRTADEKRS